MATNRKLKDLIRKTENGASSFASIGGASTSARAGNATGKKTGVQSASAFDMNKYIQIAQKMIQGNTPASGDQGQGGFDMNAYLDTYRRVMGAQTPAQNAQQPKAIAPLEVRRSAYEQLSAPYYANATQEAQDRMQAIKALGGWEQLQQEQLDQLAGYQTRYSDDVGFFDWLLDQETKKSLRQAQINYYTDVNNARKSGAFDTWEKLVLDPTMVSDDYLAQWQQTLPGLWEEEVRKQTDADEKEVRLNKYIYGLNDLSPEYFNLVSVGEYADQIGNDDPAGIRDALKQVAGGEEEYNAMLSEMIALDNAINMTNNDARYIDSMEDEEKAQEVTRLYTQFRKYAIDMDAYEYNQIPFDALLSKVNTEAGNRSVVRPLMDAMLSDPDVLNKVGYIADPDSNGWVKKPIKEYGEYGKLNAEDFYVVINNDPDYGLIDQEVALFNYHYNDYRETGDLTSAEAIKAVLEDIAAQRRRDIDRADWELLATDNAVTGALMTLGTFGANAISPISTGATAIEEMITGEESANPDVFYDFTTTTRGAQMNALGEFDTNLWKIKNKDEASGEPYVAPEFLGQTPSQHLFGAFTSAGDMATAWGLSAATGIPALGIMGAEAGANEYNALHGQNMQPVEKTLRAVATGVTEALTEKLPFEEITMGIGKPGHIKTSSLSEGGEEFFSGAAGLGIDKVMSWIFGHTDEITERVETLKLMGVENAEKQVAGEIAEDLAAQWFGGTLSGGLMAGTGDVVNHSQNARTGRTIRKSGGVDSLIELGAAMDPGTQSYQTTEEIKQETKDGKKKPSAAKVGKLYRSLMADTNAKYHDDIRETTIDAVADEITEKNNTVGDSLGDEFTVQEMAEAIVNANGNAKAIKGKIGTFIRSHRSTNEVMREFRTGDAEWAQSVTQQNMMRRASYMGQVQAIEATTKEKSAETTPSAEEVTAQNAGRVEALTGRKGGKEIKSMALTMVDASGNQSPATFKRATRDGSEIKLVVEQNGAEREVSLNDVQKISGSGVANVIAYAERRGEISAEEINTMIRLTEKTNIASSKVIAAYEAGVNAGYQQIGKPNMPSLTQGLSRENAKTLGDIVQMGYDAGTEEAASAETERIRAAKNRKEMLGKTGSFRVTYLGEHESMDSIRTGGVHMSMNRLRGELTEQQNAAVDALTQVSQAVGVNVAFYRSRAEKGKIIEMPNGLYDDAKQTIYIDLNAGQNEGGQKMVENAIMKTGAHELTHYIERGSADGYNQLRKLVKDRLQAQGKDYMQMMLDKVRESQTKLTRAKAEAEVIADACELMLRDTKAIQELAQNNRKLATRIARFVTDFARRIKRAIGSFMPTTKESAALTEMKDGVLKYVDGLQEAWDKALIEAAGGTTQDAEGNITKKTKADFRAAMMDDVSEQVKEQAVEALANAGDAQMTETVAGNVADEIIEAAVDAAIQSGETLAQRMDSDALNELANDAVETDADQGAVHVAAVLAAGEVRSVEGIGTAVENALGEVYAMGGLAGKTAEQVETIRQNIETALKTAALRVSLPQELAQTEEGEILRATKEAAGRAVEAVYEGGNENVRTALNELADNAAAEAVEGLAFQQAVDAAENRAQAREQGVEIGESVQYSERKHYDYSKPFAQQVDDWIGTVAKSEKWTGDRVPTGDSLVMGATPEVLKKIGLAELPMVFNNDTHLKNAIVSPEDKDHELSVKMLKRLPELLKNPVAVIESASHPTLNVVAIVEEKVNGKQMIMPVEIGGERNVNNYPADVNVVSTAFGKTNVLTKLLPDAMEKELAGKQAAVYYINKKRAIELLTTARVQFPGDFSKDGYIHSISDPLSPVNKKSLQQTETQQFKRWFKGSVVVNADGTPKVVYHGTNGDFNTFQSNNGTYWFSESDDYAEAMAHERGGKRIVKAYLSLRNPYRTSLPANQFSNDNFEAPIIRKAKARGYDGVIIENETDSEYAKETFYVVFEPTQIKSATDNIGLFDPKNPDIRYSRRRATAPSFRQAMMDMPITDDMTPLEKELLTKYKGYVQEYNEKQEQINAQAEIISAEAEKKENADKDAVTKANNRMTILKTQQRRVEEKLYQAEKRGGYANLMNRYRAAMQAYMAGDSVEEAGKNIARQIASVERQLEEMKRSGMDISPRELEEKLAKLVDKRYVDQVVDAIVQEWNPKMAKTKIRQNVAMHYALMAGGAEDSSKVQQHLEQFIRDMTPNIDEAGQHKLEVLKDNVSGTLILDKETAEEIKTVVGSVAQYRNIVRKVFKSVRVAKDGEKGNVDVLLENAPDWVKQEVFGDSINEKDFALAVYDAVLNARAQDVFSGREGAELLKAQTAKLLAIMEKQNATSADRRVQKLLKEWYSGTLTGKDLADAELSNAIDALWIARKKAYELSKETNAKELVEYYTRLNEQNRLEQERENLQKAKEAVKTTIASWYEERNLMEERTKLHESIRRQMQWMDRRIRNETDQRRIPEGLKPVVEEAIRIFVRANDNLNIFPKSQVEYIQTVYEKLRNVHGSDAHQMDDLLQDELETALELLREKVDAYARTAGKAEENTREARLNRIRARADILRDVSEVVDVIRHAVDETDSILMGDHQQRLSEVSGRMTDEMKARDNYSERDDALGKIARGTRRLLQEGNLTPPYFFRMLKNKTLTDLNQDLLDAQSRHAMLFKEATEKIRAIQEETNYFAWKNKAPLTITTWQGRLPGVSGNDHTIQLTAEEALSLWATWRREHVESTPLLTSSHLERGGFNLKGKQRKENGRIIKDNTPHRLNAGDMAMIDAWLTDDMKAYAAKMMDYMSHDLSELGNEVSMYLFGIRKFTEEAYFPMKVQRAQLEEKSNAGRRSGDASNRIANMSSSKRRVDQASKPLEIGAFTDVAADHIEQMIRYATFAIPIENFNKVLNQPIFEGEVIEDDGTGTPLDATSRMTLRGLFEQKYGSDALSYLRNYLTDVNGGPGMDTRNSGPWKKMTSLFKKSAVTASLSVAVQQPMSVWRAMAVISPKYFVPIWQNKDKVNVGKEWEQLTQYSGVALIKERGGFDMTGTRSLASQLAGTSGDVYGVRNTIRDAIEAVNTREEGARSTKIKEAQRAITQKADDIMGWLPAKADQATWSYIWRAVKAETAERNPSMDVNGEEFLQLAARRFEEVINLTQVYDSTLVRSQSMRSKNEFMQMVTAFMAEPTLTANMLMEGVRESKQQKNPKPLLKATTVFLVSQTMTALAKALVTAGRDDDEEKPWVEKYLSAAEKSLFGIGGELNPFTLFPWVSDAISIAEGYDVSRSDMDAFDTLVNETLKAVRGKYDDDPWLGIQNVGGAYATMLGIPLKNIMRDTRTIITDVKHIVTDQRDVSGYAMLEDLSNNSWLYSRFSDRDNGWYSEELYKAIRDGDEKEQSNLTEYLQTVKGKDEGQIKTMVRDAVKGHVLSGELTEEQAKSFLLNSGLAEDQKDAYRYVDRWVETEANKDVEGYTYSQYNSVYEAISAQDVTAINAAVKELQDNGVLTEKGTMKTTLRSKYREQLLELNKTNKTAFANLQSMLVTTLAAAGYKRADALEYIKGWLKDK